MSVWRTGTFEGAGGVRLFFRSRTVERPAARLLALHGLGDHSGRLDRIAELAATGGLETFALDLRGHGRSGGRRGHAGALDRLLTDVDRFRRRTGDGAGRATFVLGHSLGGLIAGRYVQEFGFAELAGVVLVAPFVELAMRAPRWKLWLGDVADRLLPTLTLDSGIRSDLLFRAAGERRAYDADSLVHQRISARLWGEMRREAERLVRRADQSRVPLLLQLAGDDRVVSNRAARTLADRHAGDAEVIEYEGAYHDVYRDPVGERAGADLRAWIRKCLARGEAREA